MRTTLIAGALAAAALGGVLLVGLPGPATAQQGNRAFCSLDQDSRMLCYYDTWQQCQEAMRGVQGGCMASPYAAAQQQQKKKK